MYKKNKISINKCLDCCYVGFHGKKMYCCNNSPLIEKYFDERNLKKDFGLICLLDSKNIPKNKYVPCWCPVDNGEMTLSKEKVLSFSLDEDDEDDDIYMMERGL